MNYKPLIWSGTLVLIILGIFLLVMTEHISSTATTTNTISFDGEGKVVAKPDIAMISFAIVTEAKTSKAAQDDNSKKSQQVVETLKKMDIDEKDIKTTGYNIYPKYSYPRPIPMGTVESYPQYYDSNPRITGYEVNQSFQVKVRDLDKASDVLDNLVTAGANQVNNLGFSIDDMEKVREEARSKAIANAKEKADKLKSELGVKLGKIVNYYEGGNYPMPMYAKSMEGYGIGGGGDSVAPALPTGENEIIINVTITYQIK